MTKPATSSTTASRPPPSPSARSIYLSAVDAFKASVFSSSFSSSTNPAPPSPSKDRSAAAPTNHPAAATSKKFAQKHKPAPPPPRPSTTARNPVRRPLSATVSDASSTDDDHNLGIGWLGKNERGHHVHNDDESHTDSDSATDSDESWASSSDGEPTEQLPGSFWRPSDTSSSSDDDDDVDDDSSDSGPTTHCRENQPRTTLPTSLNTSHSASHSTTSTLPSDESLTSDAASQSLSDAMTESSASGAALPIGKKTSSRRRKTAGPGLRGNLSIHTGSSVNDRRDQARLLLVSLLENFCMLYSPEENKLLFQILCEKLSAMGIITEADYNDHFSTVRGMYKRAFKELVFQALVATRAARDGQPTMKSSASLLLEYSRASSSPASSTGKNGVEREAGAASTSPEESASSGQSSGSEADDTPAKTAPGSSSDDGANGCKSRSSITKRPVRANSASSDSVTVNPSRAAAAAAAGLADLLDLHTTRYRTDFDEIRRLGRGGFGSVWHVRHRLDGREYAIKKVMLENPKDFDRVLREVKVLARMDHPNIVRYHSAWLEHDEVSLTKPVSGGGSGGASADDTFGTENSMDLTTSSARLDNHSHASSSAGITFARDSHGPSANVSDADDNGDDAHYRDPNSVKQPHGTPSVNGTSAARPILASPYRPLTLFIQMELCYSSLHDYLLHRNTLRHLEPAHLVAETNFLFSAMLVALEYIHERGTSHRDLTPRNLFLARKPGQYLRAAKARASVSGPSAKVQRGNSGTLVIENEAALPLCEWLKVGSLDDISIKIGDFGLVTEHGRRSDTSIFTTPTHSPSSVRAPWTSKLNGTGSSASPDFGSRPRILPEPAGRMSPRATSEDDDAGGPVSGDPSSPIMPHPLPPAAKPPVPRLPPGVAASVPPRSASPRSPVSSGASALATPPLPPATTTSAGVNAGQSPIAPPIRLPPHLRRLPSHAPTLGIGTATYSAPEQIARSGSSKYRWHPITSDMFSLGVILFELLQPFTTGMERLITLERLRAPMGADRTLPPEFISVFPQYAAMVLWLTAEDPAHRPTPSELLSVFPPPVPDAFAGGASAGGSSRGNSTRGSSGRGLARSGRRGSNTSIGSNGNTPTRCHGAQGTAASVANDSEIARLKRIIEDQAKTIAERDKVIDELRTRLEEVHVKLGPPLTPPRVATPEAEDKVIGTGWGCTTEAFPMSMLLRKDD